MRTERFESYRPVITELFGLSSIAEGVGKILWSGLDPHIGNIFSLALMEQSPEQMLATKQGLDKLRDGLILLGKSPITCLVLTCLGLQAKKTFDELKRNDEILQ